MDSASRLSLEANSARNALRGASRVSLWNQTPSTELKYVPHENFAKQKCLFRGFPGTHTRYSRFLSSFTCRVLYPNTLEYETQRSNMETIKIMKEVKHSRKNKKYLVIKCPTLQMFQQTYSLINIH